MIRCVNIVTINVTFRFILRNSWVPSSVWSTTSYYTMLGWGDLDGLPDGPWMSEFLKVHFHFSCYTSRCTSLSNWFIIRAVGHFWWITCLWFMEKMKQIYPLFKITSITSLLRLRRICCNFWIFWNFLNRKILCSISCSKYWGSIKDISL